jgi:hypothetical protein
MKAYYRASSDTSTLGRGVFLKIPFFFEGPGKGKNLTPRSAAHRVRVPPCGLPEPHLPMHAVGRGVMEGLGAVTLSGAPWAT